MGDKLDNDDEPRIVAFPSVKPDGWVKPVRASNTPYDGQKACKHRQIVVDVKERTVSCDLCGAVVDPFDAILVWMDYDYTLDHRVQAIQDYERREREREQRERDRRAKRKGGD